MKTLFVFVILGCAAWNDLKHHRIPNWLTLPSIIVGLLLCYFDGGIEGLKSSAIGLTVGFTIFLIPFALGGMGGGDVKLMAAVGALIGWPLVVWAILLSCIVALFGAIAKAIWKGRFTRLLVNTGFIIKNTLIALALRRPVAEIKEVTRIQAAVYVPFGAAIAIGTIWAMLLQYVINQGIVGQLPYF
jgi:prepilin peptidase CpaA